MHKLFFLIFLMISFSFSFSQTTDASGKKQGYWKKKDDKTNKLIYEGAFLNNIPNGKFKYYHPNDSIKAIMIFSNNGEISYSELFNPNGKKMAKGKYFKELKDSIWIYYDDSGRLISKENYTKGKKEGGSFVYLPDGSISEEKNYKQDIQHGEFKQYAKLHMSGSNCPKCFGRDKNNDDVINTLKQVHGDKYDYSMV